MRVFRGVVVTAALLGATLARGIDFADPDWKWRLPGQGKPAVSFRALDADRDGWLTRREAGRHPVMGAHFARADLDGDGRLSPLEFNHAALQLGAAHAAGSSVVPGTLGMTLIERDGRVVVSAAGRNTPAANGGVRAGDIVLRYDGEAITGPRDLYRRIIDTAPGSVVELEILRAGEPRRLKLRVEQFDTTPRA